MGKWAWLVERINIQGVGSLRYSYENKEKLSEVINRAKAVKQSHPV